MKLTSNYAVAQPAPQELIEVSIIKEHKGVLPFVEKIKDTTDDYDVPNVKAIKQVRKEIEDELQFVKGSAAQSIVSKYGASATGASSFAVGMQSSAMAPNSVAIGVGAQTPEDANMGCTALGSFNIIRTSRN